MKRSRAGPGARALVGGALIAILVSPVAGTGHAASPAPAIATSRWPAPSAAELADAAETQVVDRHEPPSKADPIGSMRDALALHAAMPASAWSIPSIADRLDYDPGRIFAFVRALETEMILDRARWVADDAMAPTSTSLAMWSPLVVTMPAEAGHVPATAQPALLADLRDGWVVAALGDPATATAWWSIDPSGRARAVLAPGSDGGRLDIYRSVNEKMGKAIRGDLDSIPSDRAELKRLEQEIYRQYDAQELAEQQARQQARRICVGGTENSQQFCISRQLAWGVTAVGLGAIVVGLAAAVLLG